MSRQGDGARAALRCAVDAATGLEPGALLSPPSELVLELDPLLLKSEVGAILVSERAERGLQRLYDEGILSVALPEVADLVGFGEGDHRHKDVWEHTKRVVAQAPREPLLRWAALLHDIGKVLTKRIDPDGQIQFHGHAEVGAKMAGRLLRRLEFPKDEARHVRLLVLFHQRPSQYESSWTDSAVRRFGLETEEVLADLLALSRADMTTKYDIKRKRGHELIDELASRISEIRELDARVPPLPKGLGLGIIERFQLQPGPRIGVLRDAVEAAVEAGEIAANQEAEVYLDWLARHLDDL